MPPKTLRNNKESAVKTTLTPNKTSQETSINNRTEKMQVNESYITLEIYKHGLSRKENCQLMNPWKS